MRLAINEIERRMAAKLYTQTALAGAMCLPPSRVSVLLRDIREGSDVRPVAAGRLASALGCAVEDLQEGKA